MLTITLILLLWTSSTPVTTLNTPLSATIILLSFFISTLQINNSITPSSECTLLSSLYNLNSCIILLSLWVSTMIILVSTNYFYMNINPNLFNSMSSLLLIFILWFFITDNLFTLYVMFEASLLPTLMLILNWGYQPERLNSSFYFIMYTICASLPLLIIIITLNNHSFSSSISHIAPIFNPEFNENTHLNYFALVIAFIVNVPIWGVHLWLPNAHVEAPVSGSIILAGILLNLGGYGLIQITNLIFNISTNINFIVFSINLWGAFIVGLVCLTSVDINSLIAYSSVIHINLIVLGVLSNSILGIYGAILIIIAHGISSPGIFALANLNYNTTNTRNLILQNGTLSTQPNLAILWFILVAVNIAAPPSLNLASEILIYSSVLNISFSIFVLSILTTFLSGAYNLYLYSSQLGQVSKNITASINLTTNNINIGLFHCIPPFLSIVIFYLMV